MLNFQVEILSVQTVYDSRVEAVDDVQVMGPGFSPVLPAVCAGIGTDVPVSPVQRRAVLIIALERSY